MDILIRTEGVALDESLLEAARCKIGRVVFKSLRVEQFVFERRHASLLPETAGLSIGRAAISPVNPRAGLIRPGILG